MDEDRFEQLLREVATEYHRPGETPRRAMQLRLQHVRASRQAQSGRRRKPLSLAWAAITVLFRPKKSPTKEKKAKGEKTTE